MTSRYATVWVALAAVVGIGITSLLAWTASRQGLIQGRSEPSEPQIYPSSGAGQQQSRPRLDLVSGRAALRRLIDDPSRMEGHIRELTRTSGLAGSETSMHQVEYVENYWRQLGFKVIRRTYEVPMSYFNLTAAEPQPSVSICRQVGLDTPAECTELEMDKPLTDEEKINGISRPFYAYSKPLSGKFGLVYLSNAHVTMDPDQLAEALTDKLVLVPGNEPSLMEALIRMTANLTTGFLLIHSPPEDTMPFGNETTIAYPNGTGSPDTAVTFHLGIDDAVGDPSTPGYPSHWYAVRRAPKDGWESVLNTTVIPISIADAERLRKVFDQETEEGDNSTAPYLQVHWPLRFGYRQVHDSCAEVPGSTEPDRVVLLASHRDAWYAGAIDPHTGMATMLETGRALAEMMKTKGWRPRRTILMCAWDAEELGLMGSVEWVEEEYQRAGARLVAYFNTDTDVMGNWRILVQASDQMVDSIRGVMSEMPNPTSSLTKLPASSPYFFFLPLDDASDYFAFTRALGVPACDLSYIRGPRETLVLYELYHTRYETMRLYRMLDPGGLAHQGITQSVASLVYTYADSPILPLNMSAFAEGLRKRLEGAYSSDSENPEGDAAGDNATASLELRGVLMASLDNATQALHKFERQLAQARSNDGATSELQQRMLNDKIMLVQKAFTHHNVFPGDPTSFNLITGEVFKSMSVDMVAPAVILGLNSVPKILTDSFVED